MNPTLITAVALGITLSTVPAGAQSWIFQPGTYTKTYGPAAPKSGAKPRAYATFTESQAVQAAQLPKPTFQWDPTGVIGRGQRDEFWRHQEAMEATRLRTYAQGVRDAVGAPIWTWNGATPQPLPTIIAPTAKSPGKTRSLAPP